MKLLKHITIFIFLLVVIISCTKENNNLDELKSITAPNNVSAIFDITQDNSGLVTIVPNAEGAALYRVTFGDVEDEIPAEYTLGEAITHIYSEGEFNVGITAVGLTGLTTKYEQSINVSFKAPENLVVTIEVDATNPKMVNVSATADFATIMDIYFGDVANEEPVHALPEEIVTHTYAEAGDYEITVVAKSAGSATIEYSEVITISAASDPVELPVTFESYTVNYAFSDFGNAIATVIDNPDPSGINESARVAQFVKPTGSETWAGSFLTLGSPIDFTGKKLFKVKVWSPKAGAIVKLKVENLTNGDIAAEVDALTTVTNQWEELSFDFSSIDLANAYQKIVIFFDFDNPGDDATYYFDDIKLTNSTGGPGIVGTWKIAPVAGSLGVGPEFGDISWWSIDEAGVLARECFYNDTYVFGADGSFTNVLGADTWIEGWQGGSDACGTPVAPHDGSNPATYTYDAIAGTITLNGTGSYLGIPKPYNGGELTTPADAPASITYLVSFSADETEMTVDISIGTGWWRFIMVKEGSATPSPYEGTWKIAPEAGSLGVGPEFGDISWWSIDAAGVTARACFYDDTYVFGADGSFTNVVGTDTWIEGWQGGADACGTPVAPHDGSNPATYSYDESAGTVTLNGTGSYLGIPKAYNGGELTTPSDAPTSVTYLVTFSENNTRMTVDIDIATGWWRFIMVKN